MRRPVKPFVTEYRGTTRRLNGGSASGQGQKVDPLTAEPERSEPRPTKPWVTGSARLNEPQEDSYEAALRAADALFSSSRAAAAPAPADPKSSESHASPAPHPAGGRVLRAIDEPPSAEMLRLEAEYAPKRRGRKPGSKNKPKAPAPVVEEAFETQAPFASAPPPFPVIGRIAATTASIMAKPAATRVPAAGIREERYAWVRTKLKPGEQWKRRIPKIAW